MYSLRVAKLYRLIVFLNTFKKEDNRLKNNDKRAKRLRKTKLFVGDIKTDPETFQFRDFEITESHVYDLGKTLKEGRELDPMLVWDSGGGGYVVIDGHHRHAAYCRHKPRAKITVEVFAGTKEEAVELALEDNGKARLPMTQQEKSNAAWQLVCRGYGFSRAQISKLTGLSTGTVSTMRKTMKALIAEKQELPRTWRQAMWALKSYEQEDVPDDWWEARIEERARKLDDEIGPALGRMAEIQIEAVIRVMERRLGNKTKILADWWSEEDLEDSPY